MLGIHRLFCNLTTPIPSHGSLRVERRLTNLPIGNWKLGVAGDGAFQELQVFRESFRSFR